jgi:hypothetical protein
MDIGEYNVVNKHFRKFCNYYLENDRSVKGGFCRKVCVKWWFYILIFIPLHLLNAVICVWDGGLKEFEIQKRHVQHDYIDNKWTDSYEKCCAIFDNN